MFQKHVDSSCSHTNEPTNQNPGARTHAWNTLAELKLSYCVLSLGFCVYVYTLIIIHLPRHRGARYADGVFADEYSITGSKHYVNKHHKNY